MICFYTLFYNFVHIAFITAGLPGRTVVVRDGVMEVQHGLRVNYEYQ